MTPEGIHRTVSVNCKNYCTGKSIFHGKIPGFLIEGEALRMEDTFSNQLESNVSLTNLTKWTAVRPNQAMFSPDISRFRSPGKMTNISSHKIPSGNLT